MGSRGRRRPDNVVELTPEPDEEPAEPGPCPLCGRPMVEGPSVEAHHLVPRAHGGRETVQLHRICHRKIHAELSERDIARHYSTIALLQAHPAIADFIRWVAGKPPTFSTDTDKRKDRR
jgi:5-methylcytosine-specific restriction endonuclease McrA